MNLPEFGVKRPTANLMIFVGIIIISLYGLSQLGVDMMPEIEPPAISVVSSYPGASPEDVEIRVTEPLENQLGTTPGIDKITSRSLEGISVLTLKFNWGTDLNEASNDIRDRIEMAKRYLPDIPEEMDNPFIFKFNTAMIPILYTGFTAKESYPDLYDIIDKKISDELKQLPGVGTVQTHGGLERQINIWIDRRRLEGYGFSVLDIRNVLKQENITQPAGNIKSGLTDYLVRIPGEFASPEEIDSVILGERNGNLVYLKDVARIEDGHKEKKTIVRINRKQGLIMIVQKQTGTNSVQVAERIKKKLASLKKNLPRDVECHIIMDTSEDVISTLDTLKSTIWLGVMLVILIIWFFLRQIRPSLIVALTLPFSLLISFTYLFLAGKTINVISLSALVISLGMVVDAAIVVVDNVHRHIERKKRPQEAAIFGTSEIFTAIAASTLTTVVVFAPLLFVKGVVGIMFGEMAAVIIITLLGSLFTAATFTPMLCSKWIRVSGRVDTPRKKDRFIKKLYLIFEIWFQRVEKLYSDALYWSLQHKKTVIFGLLGFFIISLFFIRFVGNEFIPEEDSGDLRITVTLPIGTRVEETDKVASRIEDIFEKYVPEEKFVFARSGTTSGMGAVMGGSAGTHIASTGAKLVKKDERERSAREIAQEVRKEIEKIPGIFKMDIATGNPLGRVITGTGGKAIQVEIIGHSFEETNKLAYRFKEIMEGIPGAVDVSISRELRRPEFKIKVDREKASVLGLNMNAVADTIKTYIEGSIATRYRERGDTYDIYVRLEEDFRQSPEDIENFPITSTFTGKQIKLSNIAEVVETVGAEEIERQNRERVVKVQCNTHGRSMGKIIEDIKKEMNKIVIPEGIIVNFGGEAEEQKKAFGDLFLLLILGIALVYMVMAAQFESLLDPFIVMFAIPFTFTGVILAFIVTRTTLSVISFLGIVMLTGIVVNNAIVLISYINILRARGFSMIEAVTKGGKDRLRPVLMTTFTTLFAMIPLALSRGQGSEIWQPLGITMIGGLSVSTFITLLFVPTLYAVFEAKVRKNGVKKQ
ncbi:MAG: efflux RND transporter permease subunit [Candidatus Omnitrophica bacterium]|nr:efflux RND transporter permease subunit [Candidatus Omnitrophota bacterium]